MRLGQMFAQPMGTPSLRPPQAGAIPKIPRMPTVKLAGPKPAKIPTKTARKRVKAVAMSANAFPTLRGSKGSF